MVDICDGIPGFLCPPSPSGAAHKNGPALRHLILNLLSEYLRRYMSIIYIYICFYNIYIYVYLYIFFFRELEFFGYLKWDSLLNHIQPNDEICDRMINPAICGYSVGFNGPRCCRFPTVVSYSWGTLGSCTSIIQEPGPQAVGRCCTQPPIIVFHIWSVWKWGIPYTHVHPKLLPLRILDTENHRSPGDLGPEPIGDSLGGMSRIRGSVGQFHWAKRQIQAELVPHFGNLRQNQWQFLVPP